MSRLRSIVKHVTEMRAALAARHFGSPHHETIVLLDLDALFGYGRPKTRPAGAGVELGIGREKLIATARAPIQSLFMMIPILAGERSLGALLPANVILLLRQLFLPFIVAFFDLFHLSSGSRKKNFRRFILRG
jgi:hypothetical protein